MSDDVDYRHHLQVCGECRVCPPFRLCARGCELLQGELRAMIPEQLEALASAFDLMGEVGAREDTQRLVARGALAAALALTQGRGVPTWVLLSELGIFSGLLFGHYYRRAGPGIDHDAAEEFRADLVAWTQTMVSIADRVRVAAAAADAEPLVVH